MDDFATLWPAVVGVLFLGFVVVLLVRKGRPTPPKPKPGTGGPEPRQAGLTTPVGALATPARMSPAAQAVPTVALTAVNGSLAGRTFPILSAGLRIGRQPDNHVVLNEQMVSRQHAEIVPTNGGFAIRDCHSVNGVFVDGMRVDQRPLLPGNRIQIGFSEFVFHLANAPAGAPPVPIPAQDTGPAPRSLGDYVIEGVIGGGGMAEVFRARARDNTLVAIKVPKVVNDPYLLQKFEAEGNQIGSLLHGHPHIVQVIHFGYTPENTPYIVMEYVDGGSLRTRLRQPLTEADIRRIIGQTCLALAYAHHKQVVHRDIKPENILLTADGQVKVADFGIARLLSGVTVTHRGPVGTPEYMSPEQAKGEPVQPASDIYAAGVVLYELLTGQVPFARRADITDEVQQALNVVERHLRETPRPPHELRAGVSPELEKVALQALAKDPRKRFRNGEEMAKALGVQGVVRTPTQIAPVKLVALEGAARGQTFPFQGDVLELTRQQLDPTSTLISRQHAVLRRRGGDFWLEDTSRNGTWINDQRVVGVCHLSVGDTIRIGDCVLRLEA